MNASSDDVATGQIRGSSLLLVGRLVALGLAFATQIVTVRYLPRGDYGAFAYALSLVTFVESFALLGLDRAVARFVPIFDEEGDQDRAWGVVVLVVGTILTLGLAAVVLVAGLAGVLTKELEVPAARTVLMVVILLGPLQALDRLGTSLLAIFTSPSSIFFRKYILGPGLRLLAVLALVVSGSGVVFLAVAYIAAGAVGVAVYAAILRRAMVTTGRWSPGQLSTIRVPWRPVFAFALPLMTTDVVFTTLTAIDGVMLGTMRGASDVAALRAVQPVARLNQLVLQSFGVLFTPAAARMFARRDDAGINSLYWRTATWVALLSFPIVAVTFMLAQPATTLFFGSEYRDAAPILAILSLGYYVHAALGFNGMVLNVYSRVREVVILNVVAAVGNVLMNLWLIPRHGALGAAVATASTLLAHNLMKQFVLGRRTGVDGFDRAHRREYLVVVAGLLTLVVYQVLAQPRLVPSILAVVIVGGVVLAMTRRSLAIADTFPELGRLPVVGRWLRR